MEPTAIEVEALIESVRMRYGLDLRGHPRPPLRQRLLELGAHEGVESLSELQGRVLRDPSCFERLAESARCLAEAPFRDPGHFAHLRRDVLPRLRTWPTIQVWVACCATGEEVLSLMIVLKEEGLLNRSRVYATDRNRAALETARRGRQPAAALEEMAASHALAGGRGALSDHFTRDGDEVVFDPSLLAGVTFSVHDLATDARFNGFQFISCRNVLPQFSETDRPRMLRLFDASLVPFGMIALDSSEPEPTEAILRHYEPVCRPWRTLRKVP